MAKFKTISAIEQEIEKLEALKKQFVNPHDVEIQKLAEEVQKVVKARGTSLEKVFAALSEALDVKVGRATKAASSGRTRRPSAVQIMRRRLGESNIKTPPNGKENDDKVKQLFIEKFGKAAYEEVLKTYPPFDPKAKK